MANVSVRNLDDAVVDLLRSQAENNGRSLEAELRRILTEAAKPSLAESAEELRRFQKETWGDRIFSDSSVLIREDRDR